MQMNRPRAIIAGVGAYYPEYILNNEELSRMVDTSDEWIMTRVGIKERRILKDPTKGSAWMGAQAVKDLLAKKIFLRFNIKRLDYENTKIRYKF